MRLFKKRLAPALLSALLPLLGWAGAARAAAPAAEQFVREHGPDYSLSLDGAGNLYYKKAAVQGLSAAAPEPMQGVALERFTLLTERIQGQEPDKALAPVLQALLRPTLGEANDLVGRQLYTGEGDARALTALGRNVLMDLLTARDGVGVEEQMKTMQAGARTSRQSVIDRLRKEGQLTHLAEKAADGSSFFDQAAQAVPQTIHSVEAYGKWDELGKSGFKDAYIDEKTGNLRLIVAAGSAVAADRFKVLNGKESNAIYKETGLDKGLISSYGGKIVRAIDNLVEVDVSKEQARGLGLALETRGIHSTVNMAVKMADAVGQGFAEGRFPLSGILPFSRKIFSRLSGKDEVQAQSADSRNILKADSLWGKGMDGTNSVVAIVDSGLDMKHPDFKDRVLAYVDLTQSNKDTVGHGTHVAGLTGGDGAASGGLYKGMAPKAKFVVIQIFGGPTGGGASEMTILAAMKILTSLPKNLRPDVVNMSLGINPPVGNNLQSSSLMADWLMVASNMFMSVAAGNSGPKQYTIGAPGNARHVLTVTGTDKKKEFPFFPSRGPVVNWPWKEYNKPDISTVAGGVDRENPCPYAPGLASTRSSDENFPSHVEECKVPGNDKYRYMSGTSMATPLATGIVADVIGYLKAKGMPYTTAEVKALIMETADDLGQPAYVQGAGLVDGEKLAKALEERVKAGASAGNVALMLSRDATPFQKWYLAKNKGIVATGAGLLDTRTNHIVNTDQEVDALRSAVDKEFASKSWLERMKIKVEFKLAQNNREEVR